MPGPSDGADEVATPDDEPEDGGDGPATDGAEVLGSSAERSALPRTGVTVGVLALLGVALVAAGRAVQTLTRP
jgi:hypothetical protein